MAELVQVRHDGPVTVIAIDRREVRNAVDRPTAEALAQACRDFDADDAAAVAILHGLGGTFCAGADLGAIAAGDPERINRFAPDGDAPMGVSRMRLGKPVIAAIEGYAVAGGLELALWADLRVADENATLGGLLPSVGVPLIDGGTVRLPRLIGESRAMDLILTGRPVDATEAHAIGLVNRVAPAGTALEVAVALAHDLAAFPQTCLREDRMSVLEQDGLTLDQALLNETRHGATSLVNGTAQGAGRFVSGAGRHGTFDSGTP